MLVIFFGACYLFYKFLPLRSQTNQNAALLGFGVGAFHGVITIAFVMLGKMISTDFASFYTSSFHFVGQLAGLMVPSITILLLTDLTYGGVAGGILVAVHGICSLKKSITP